MAGADASTPAVSTSSPAQQQQQQLEAYTSACSQVPDDVLIRWVHHQVKSDPESLWALKKTLALQLSCSSLVGYALSVGQRQPHTFGFATHSGQCMSSDFHPCYKPESAVIDANEVFMLTLISFEARIILLRLSEDVSACTLEFTICCSRAFSL